jgi:hypothetical protein
MADNDAAAVNAATATIRIIFFDITGLCFLETAPSITGFRKAFVTTEVRVGKTCNKMTRGLTKYCGVQVEVGIGGCRAHEYAAIARGVFAKNAGKMPGRMRRRRLPVYPDY